MYDIYFFIIFDYLEQISQKYINKNHEVVSSLMKS